MFSEFLTSGFQELERCNNLPFLKIYESSHPVEFYHGTRSQILVDCREAYRYDKTCRRRQESAVILIFTCVKQMSEKLGNEVKEGERNKTSRT